jgi:hypothetical protein
MHSLNGPFSKARLFIVGSLLLGVLALGGCASMNKDECMTVDWRTVGYEDGAAGHSGNRIAQHRKACAKHGVTPDLAAYQTGREEGLFEFCKPSNGFRIGARGNGYDGVCPASVEREFVAAYEAGRQLYTLRSRVTNTANRIDSLHAEIDNIDDDLISTAAEIMKSDTSIERRAQLVLDTKRMAERRGQIKAEIPQLQYDLAHYQRDLADYRARLAYAE